MHLARGVPNGTRLMAEYHHMVLRWLYDRYAYRRLTCQQLVGTSPIRAT
jgi:hypothetical protein